jgi:hypothetical protein
MDAMQIFFLVKIPATFHFKRNLPYLSKTLNDNSTKPSHICTTPTIPCRKILQKFDHLPLPKKPAQLITMKTIIIQNTYKTLNENPTRVQLQ